MYLVADVTLRASLNPVLGRNQKREAHGQCVCVGRLLVVGGRSLLHKL